MLLPSDVARLVLGYLQEEGLTATSRTFINESPNLKEYLEYSVEDGIIPACVFSVFGKGLTTILNEYMATKTKESSHEVPAVMTSLWKKLDFTLKQIKSLQTSPATSGSQRVRSRVGVANLVRQQALTLTSTSAVICSTLSESSAITCPAPGSPSVLSHSTPVSFSAPNIRTSSPCDSSVRLLVPRDSPLQISVSETRMNPGPMSPGRRKWETPRKRSVAVGGTTAARTSAGDATEAPQPEEVSDEKFPHLVIQSARDKILGDKSLQEKLAQNINKILANEPVPQTSTTIEADPSIDEILGLQGEIHMSDDAIHDILEQTESDPAFQALFDLFEYNKNKTTSCEATHEASSVDVNPEDTEAPGASTAEKQVHNNDQAPAHPDASPSATRAVQPRKTRKTTTLLKKTLLDTSGRSSRIEKSSAKLLINPGQRSSGTSGGDVSQMDVDEAPLPLPTSEDMTLASHVHDDNLSTLSVLSESLMIPPPETQSSDGVQPSEDQDQVNDRADSFSPAASNREGPAPPASTSSTAAPPSSVAPSTASDASKTESPNTPSKEAADSGNIVSLKIIISDNNEQESASDAALNQAVSSIPADRIPTIYLSSPAKSPAASARSHLDEAALAVNGLQNSEVQSVVVPATASTAPQAQQNYIIQLPLDPSSASAPGASYFLVTEPAGADGETRQILVPAANAPSLPTMGQFGVSTTLAQGFTPGSTFILPSPGKPMMLPVSVTGQNTVQVMPNQIVAIQSHVPIARAEKPKPSPVKGSLAAGAAKRARGKRAHGALTKQKQQNITRDSSPGHRRILCFDASAGVEPQTTTNTPDKSPPRSVKPSEDERTPPHLKPNILSGNKPKRRVETVRCAADSRIGEGFGSQAEKTTSPPQPPQKKNSRKQEHNVQKRDSQTKVSDKVDASSPAKTSARTSASKERKPSEKREDAAAAPDPRTRSQTESVGAQKDKDESKDAGERGNAKSRDGRPDKRTHDVPNVTANKENEVKGSSQDQQQTTAPVDPSPPDVCPRLSTSQSKTAKVPSKTSSLAKQAAEMLQDIQGVNSPVRPGRRAEPAAPRTPGTACHPEENLSSPRTPSRTRRGKDLEGTPKHVMLPHTPDVPGCSPASEAGSENSINMAAHTLMILSRAAIARTGSPLKDSLRQEEVGDKSPSSSKTPKKRKQASPANSPPPEKEAKKSTLKKKEREKKKPVDCFPLDLDVDKFLSSLHYDE